MKKKNITFIHNYKMSAYYAVAKGNKTGIFSTWAETQKYVIGVKGSIYKKFTDYASAENYIRENSSEIGVVQHNCEDKEISNKITKNPKEPKIFNTKSKSKYYAVARGVKPGIYTDWIEAKKNIKGFSCPLYKSFPTREEAENYIAISTIRGSIDDDDEKGLVIYTDGSYSPVDGLCGFGIVITDDGSGNKLYAYGNVPTSFTSKCTNNIAELYAIYKAISLANSDVITIYSDSCYSIDTLNTRLRTWSNAELNKAINKEILILISESLKNKEVYFRYCKAHSGIICNEEADRLAEIGRVSNQELITTDKFPFQ